MTSELKPDKQTVVEPDGARTPSPKRVLVIEDDEKTSLLLTDNLRQEGYEVIPVFDGETGVKAAMEQLPDIILLDLLLPKLDGWEVCRRLRQPGAATLSIPIIIVSVLAKDIASSTPPMGSISLFNKPFEVNALLTEVKRMIVQSVVP